MQNISVVTSVVILSTSSKPSPFVPPDRIVTGAMRVLIEIVFDLCICSALCFVGIITNILDLAVFYRQGYKTTVNISMSFMAFFDLVKSSSGLLHRLYGPILLHNLVLAKTWENFTRASLAFVQTFAVYTSSVLAGYVAVERCLCVLIPFTVKSILTPRFTWVTMSILSLVTYGSFGVVFAFYDYIWEISAVYNQTVGTYTFSQFYWRNVDVVVPYYNTLGILWPFTSLVVISISTFIISYQLQKSSKFRNSNKKLVADVKNPHIAKPNAENTQGLGSRDKQVVKMLLAIIIVYIFALTPRIALFIAKFFEPELYLLKTYHNLFFVLAYSCFILDFINSTANFFIFFAMSSQFRITLQQIFNIRPAGN
ncbi:uncharacterized protein LOC131927446 [Physella acuta]|uniref:uncharacterized protein LOC131927446 n=1 Tax=Physella acuta TaxID=109671 RepID=UPI0027DD5974|nr:uncharacterized protein LOC131927446 [Physella acuta]